MKIPFSKNNENQKIISAKNWPKRKNIKKNNDDELVLKDRKRDENDNILGIKCLFCDSQFSPSTGNSSLKRQISICPKKPH